MEPESSLWTTFSTNTVRVQKKLERLFFPKSDNSKHVYDIINNELWSWKIFSKLSIIKDTFRPTMIGDRLNFLSIFSIEDHITKSLSYEDMFKEYAAKNTLKGVTSVN